MTTYQCPKGHASTDPDYCSECGMRIGSSTVVHATPSAAPAPSAEVCPDCSTPRTPGARFCEVCRYDFEKGSSSAQVAPSTGASAAVAAPPNATPTQQTPGSAAGADAAPPVANVPVDVTTAGDEPLSTPAPRLNVVVIIDPSLAEDEDMRKQVPRDVPELIFPLDLDENLVGRRSDTKKIFPEIDLSDPGISHRQLKIIRQPDGSFVALELGSANGTTLNGVALKPGLVTPLAAGDELLMGMWTRLQVRRR